ncbi:MAG: TonB family protein [Minicystis sp.]
MDRRLVMVVPLVFALGCGAAPPPAAAPPPVEGAAATGGVESKKSGAPAAPGAAAPDAAAPMAPAAAASATPKSIGKAAVSSTDAPLTSTITQDEVIHQVGKSSDHFNRCYALGAGASKSWRAKVTIKATVGPTGNVSTAEVVNSTAKNPKVDACVVEGFKKLNFPRPAGSGTTTFTFPLSFDGVEQVQ